MKGADWQHPKGPNSDLSGKDNHPVVLVSWDDAVAFCAWVKQTTGRQAQLPTEAQWEKAARGEKGLKYPWGDSEPDASKLNYNMNVKDTTAVGTYSPAGDSPYGLADMAGTLDIGMLAHVLSRTKLFITNDSGPLHLAAALKVKTLGLFGPTDPRLFGPYPLNSPTNHVVQAPVGDLRLLTARDVYARFARLDAISHGQSPPGSAAPWPRLPTKPASSSVS